jgi:L-ascorbate metabolism protein UlaG (beta-lactamase superfamily)
MGISVTMKQPRPPIGQIRGVQVRWLGHAAFEIASPAGTKLLVDPFISGNPATPAPLKDLARYAGVDKPNAILVSHSHSDHTADLKAIAAASGAPVIGVVDYVGSLQLPDAQNSGGNVGGAFKVGDVTVRFVPAIHSSAPGRPIGFVLEFASAPTMYITGDTFIFGDMALIEELYHPSIILLNVGGGPYTQDPPTAALAIKKYFHPKVIVPMHFGTFPVLATEADVKKAFAGDTRLVLMKPGETRAF